MALKQNVQLRIGLRQNKNVKSTGYNKWYGEVVLRQGLTQRGFIKHIMEHIPGITEAMTTAVIETVAQCIPELVGQGTSVKLDGIGVFYPTLNSQAYTDKAGVKHIYTKTEQQLLKDVIQPSEVVRGVRFRFKPDSTKLDNLTSKAFKKKTSIELAGVIKNVDWDAGGGDIGDTIESQLISMKQYKDSLTKNS